MRKILICSIAAALLVPGLALATTKKAAPKTATKTVKTVVKAVPKPALSYQAWVAYWDKASSTALASTYVNQLDELSPFSFTVEPDGTIIDSMYLMKEPWTSLYKAAQTSSKHTKIIPTIAWFHGSEIQTTLNDKTSRDAHVADIIGLVTRNNFDGIDIDYEGKTLETKDGFSAFITSLGTGLHGKGKTLVCTLEARTPPEDRHPDAKTGEIATIKTQYVNDYKVMAKYCDEVRLMTYDQQDDDRNLVDEKSKDSYYAPVSDPDWVTKVVNLAAKDIPKKKLVIGVPTYGVIFKIWFDKSGVQQLERMRAITYQDALTLASGKGIYPARGYDGERTFHYTKDGVEYTASFQDAESIKQKIDLAKKLGVKGVAFFKIDAKTDQDFWKYVK